MSVSKSITKDAHYDTEYGRVVPGAPMELGVNSFTTTRSSGDWMWINLIKGGSYIEQSPNPGGYDANGYPDISTSGGFDIWVTDSDEGQKNLPSSGVYTLRWAGTATNVYFQRRDPYTPAFSSAVVTPDAGYDGKIEYTVSDPDIGLSDTFVVVRGPGTCTKLELLTPGDVARYDAGNRVNSQYLSDYNGAAVYRPMETVHTNNSNIMNYSEWPDEDVLCFSLAGGGGYGFDNTENVQYKVPLYYAARGAVELGAKLWFNIPHMSTDACITSTLTELNSYLGAANRPVYIEYSNEHWNQAGGFDDGNTWIKYGDVAHQDTTNIVASTGVLTIPSHGFNQDEYLRTYTTFGAFGGNLSAPYESSNVNVRVLDTDDFYMIRQNERARILGITKGATTIINCRRYTFNNQSLRSFHSLFTDHKPFFYNIGGMTQLEGLETNILSRTSSTIEIDVDSTLFDDFVDGGSSDPSIAMSAEYFSGSFVIRSNFNGKTLRVKRRELAAQQGNLQKNYGEKSIEVWDLAEAVFGAGNLYKVLGGAANQPFRLSDIFEEVPEVLQHADYCALAPYYSTKFGGQPPSGDADYASRTPDENVDTASYRQGTYLEPQEDNIQSIGSYAIPLINYECGEGNGPLTEAQATANNIAAMSALDTDDAISRATREYFRKLAYLDMPLSVQFVGHANYDNYTVGESFVGSYGVMKYVGDTTAKKHIGFKEFLDRGGKVPKFYDASWVKP